MRRIILHWTAGTHKPSGLDLTHYHHVIDGSGQVHAGRHPVRANAGPGPLRAGAYAAHTLSCNTDSIGIAICAMAGAVERPFNPGKWPITNLQLDALAALVVRLCDEHGIAVGRETVLSHAEVQPTLGIRQRGKWDITWIPGMSAPGNPVTVGDVLRERVRARRRVTPDPRPRPPAGGLLAALSSIFGKRKTT